jgi:stress response protein SCP2
LFRQSTGQAAPPPPRLPQRNAGGGGGGGGGGGSGGAQFISSVDKSSGISSSSSSNDVPIPMGAGNDVLVGLGWDFADVDGDGQGDTDLDLSCVAFDANGQFMKACYFAEPNPFGNGACRHNGDNRDGRGEGDDESVNLDLDMLNNSGISALFFCVNSFNGSSFRAVKSASSRVVALMSGSELSKVNMALEDRRATSLISGRLARVGRAQWVFRPLAITGKNKCFADVVPTMQAQLRDIFPRVNIAPSPAGIIMTKGESLQLLSNQFKVGLGWDQVGRAVDLDASVVCLHADYTLGECCYFGALKAYGQALVHSGDNRSGAGAGDDESVTVNLNGIPPRVQYVVVTVNCYDDLPLSNVRNAYIRLSSNGAETHRYQLNQLGAAAGFTMATLYRGRGGGWLIKTNSSAGDGNTWKKMLPAIQRGCQTLLQKHL